MGGMGGGGKLSLVSEFLRKKAPEFFPNFSKVSNTTLVRRKISHKLWLYTILFYSI